MGPVTVVTFKKTILISLSTFLQSHLGSDPMTVWIDGLSRALVIPLGNASLLNNGVMLALALAFARRYIHLGTVIGALFTGPILNILDPLVRQWMGADPSLVVRILMMLAGQIIMCYAIALNLSVRFGFGTADALIVTFCDRFRLKYRNIKILADLIYTLVGFFLGGIVGIGSVVAGLTGGPIISWFRTHWTDPLMERINPLNSLVSEEYEV